MRILSNSPGISLLQIKSSDQSMHVCYDRLARMHVGVTLAAQSVDGCQLAGVLSKYAM